MSKLYFWHLSLTLDYNPNLAKVKVNICTEYQDRRSNGSALRMSADRQMNKWMDGCYQVPYLPRITVDNENKILPVQNMLCLHLNLLIYMKSHSEKHANRYKGDI